MSKATRQIRVNLDDIPSKVEMLHTVSRLRQDYDLLSRCRGSKNKEDPESFKVVAAFLEMLVQREGKNLNKKSGQIDDSLDILIEFVTHQLLAMDDWELKQTVEETSLKELVKKIQ